MNLAAAAIINTKIEGIKAANDLATAGGTPSGILTTSLGLPISLTNISVAISATIIATNNHFAPIASVE